MPNFPPAALEGAASPASLVRRIGTIDLNDKVNTWTDHVELPFTRSSVYDALVNRDGETVRVRRDRKAAEVLIAGIWIDGGGRSWPDFLASLEAVDRDPLVIGSWQYVEADVVDVAPVFRGYTQDIDPATGYAREVWAWSIKFRAFSALRVPA